MILKQKIDKMPLKHKIGYVCDICEYSDEISKYICDSKLNGDRRFDKYGYFKNGLYKARQEFEKDMRKYYVHRHDYMREKKLKMNSKDMLFLNDIYLIYLEIQNS